MVFDQLNNLSMGKTFLKEHVVLKTTPTLCPKQPTRVLKVLAHIYG
jgi:hypothetical protein